MLVPKKGCKGRPEQFRPITCLNTSYKLLTGLLTKTLRRHVDKHDILPEEQFALRPGRRGCTDALAVDSGICGSAIAEGKKLSVAWIDYKKAYDRVPHGWLKKMLAVIKAPAEVQQGINALIPKWESRFECGKGKELVTVNIAYKRGLFQGDSLSPLLFCLAIAPLSYALRTETKGFKARGENPMTHSLFMDDLKVYSKGRKRLDRALEVVDRVSKAVGMELGMEKCAVAHFKNSNVDGTIHVPDEERFRCADEGKPYCYLGIDQVIKPDTATVCARLEKEYRRRLECIWKSSLTAKMKVQATNVWAVSVFRYFFGNLTWTRKVLVRLDRMTRKVLRKHKAHHVNASLERLYLPREEGGRGLSNLEHVWERETVSKVEYVMSPKGNHLQGVRRFWEKLAGLGRANPIKIANSILERYQMGHRFGVSDLPSPPPKDLVKDLKRRQMEKLRERLQGKKMHGTFFSQCLSEGWDTKGSHAWLKEGRFRAETEAMMIAAQDGVI